MKKEKLLHYLMCAVMVMGMSVFFSSCETDSYWWDGPGYEGYMYDPTLTGYWVLVQDNSRPVAPGRENYLMFNGRGYGNYYYYENGRRYIMDTYYDCQYSNSGVSDFQMNLQYGNGYPTTINYWFTNGRNTLWMQWREYGRVNTYVYDRINGAPW
ncbi:MAG: hypothetical protein K2N05_02145 [Muribaculaceae bacterium]|nr:hypothetical protein [Muribaculaceae bacterium]